MDELVPTVAEQILAEFESCGGSPTDFVEYMTKVVDYVRQKYGNAATLTAH